MLENLKKILIKKNNTSVNLNKFKKIFTYINSSLIYKNINLEECEDNLGGYSKNEIFLPKKINIFNISNKNYNLYIYKILIFNYLKKLKIKNNNIIENLISYCYSIKETRYNIEKDGINLLKLEKKIFPFFDAKINNKILLILINKLIYKKVNVFLLEKEKKILYKLENFILIEKNLINKQIEICQTFFKNKFLNALHLWGYQYEFKINDNKIIKNIKNIKKKYKIKKYIKNIKIEPKKLIEKNINLENLFNYDSFNDKSSYKKQINFDKSISSKKNSESKNIIQYYYEKIKYFYNKNYKIENKIQLNNFKKYSYKEWDYKLLNYKENWCNIFEYDEPVLKNNELNNKFINFKKKYLNYINYLKEKIFFINNKYLWKKNQKYGEEIDFDELVNNYFENKNVYNDKIFKIKRKKNKSVFITLLVDASLSTDENLSYESKINTIKNLTLLISLVIETIYEYNISLFYSNTRHDCKYINIKKTYEQLEKKKINIMNIKPNGYTRIGPAIRHSIEMIKKRKEKFKMIILLTDGVPTDYDEYEGQYGENDVKASINEAITSGISIKFIIINKKIKLNFIKELGSKNYLVINNLKEYKNLLKIFNEINH